MTMDDLPEQTVFSIVRELAHWKLSQNVAKIAVDHGVDTDVVVEIRRWAGISGLTRKRQQLARDAKWANIRRLAAQGQFP